MDQDILVSEAQTLTRSLDGTKIAPRAVMVVESSETGTWKIWIVPRSDDINKQEFYRIVAESISSCDLKSVDVGLVELRASSNPAIVGLSKLLRFEGVGSFYFSNNTFDGILLPDGILIRMAI